MFRLNFFLLFLILLFLGSCISQNSLVGNKQTKRFIIDSPLANNHFFGIKVTNADNGEIITSYQSDKLFTPASNTKILTFFIADNFLGDSIATLKYGEKKDSLFFQGLGDPTFLHPEFTIQTPFNLLANYPGKLVYVPKTMEDERFGPGWAWDDFPYYFQAEKSTFPLFGNTIWLKKDSIDKQPLYFPKTIAINFQNDDALHSDYKIHRSEYANDFKINYSEWPLNLEKEIPFYGSDSLITKLLADTLNRPISTGQFPENLHFKTIYNYHKDSLFRKMLVDSDNLFAEQLILSTSYHVLNTFDADSLIKYAAAYKLLQWKDKISWRDGSGLSRYNMMSPDFITEILSRIYYQNNWKRICQLFPKGGTEGTLKNFLKSESIEVYAKSGSMTGVYCLSGYIKTDSGKTFIFSIMNNNFNSPIREVKQEVERILLFLKSEY